MRPCFRSTAGFGIRQFSFHTDRFSNRATCSLFFSTSLSPTSSLCCGPQYFSSSSENFDHTCRLCILNADPHELCVTQLATPAKANQTTSLTSCRSLDENEKPRPPYAHRAASACPPSFRAFFRLGTLSSSRLVFLSLQVSLFRP